MSDSLRDRIAAAIQESLITEVRVRGEFVSVYWDHDDEGEKMGPTLVGIDSTVTPERVADAVIEAIASHECREVRSKTSRDDDDDPYEAKADAARQEWAEPYQPDTNQHTLRDRIAAALFNVDNGGIVAYLETDEPEILDTDRVIDGTINFAELADAVIAALGLERQAHYDTDCRYHRYVTEWEPDDE